ncbi:MAG: RNA polymerase sigma factor [Syntrophomonadaceae bacterium]
MNVLRDERNWELVNLISDERLVRLTLDGDLSAFEELVNRYKNRIFAIVYRMVAQYQEAEDITQDVFLTVFEKLNLFDPEKTFAPWIYRIATNTTISMLRKKKKVITLNFDESYGKPNMHYPDEAIDPQLAFENLELREEISAAIMELPESYRTIITLRYQFELKNQEIADILNISKENVEVKVHRARKALRSIVLKRWKERGIANELPISR